MKKNVVRLLILLLTAAVVVAMASPVFGACNPNKRASNVDRPFYAYASYITFPGNDTADTGTFVGRFWQTSNTAVNEGTYTVDQWLTGFAGFDNYWYFIADMGTAGSGCPEGCMTMYLEDSASDTFIVWTRDEGSKQVPGNDYDYTDIGPFVAADSARPRVDSFSRAGDIVTLNLTVLDPSAAVVTDTTDCGVDGAIGGITIYTNTSATAPDGAVTAGWTSAATLGATGGSTSFDVDCSDHGSDVWVAVGLDVAGVTARFVGHPTQIECDPTLADPGQRFKLVNPKKPGKKAPKKIGPRG